MSGVDAVLIVGAGLAGSRCAEALRADRYDGAVTLVGDEPHEPYDRTRLSKTYLRLPDDNPSLRPPGHLASLDVDLLLSTSIQSIDAGSRTASDSSGRIHRWSHLVLATGSAAINPFPGAAGAPNAFVLRSRSDADAIKAAIRPKSKVVVIGAGFVGMELASTAVSLEADVTLVDTASVPLERVLGAAVGSLVAQRARDAGARLLLGATVERLTHDRSGAISRVVLGGGMQLDADIVVVAVGSRPRLRLARQLGIEHEGAVPTDALGRSHVDGVYACGDIASFPLSQSGVAARVEHWTSAAGQALAVASHIAGDPRPFLEIPYVWSDLFGMRIQRVAISEQWATTRVDGDAHECVAQYLDADGVLVAGITINRPHELAALRRQLGTRASAAA